MPYIRHLDPESIRSLSVWTPAVPPVRSQLRSEFSISLRPACGAGTAIFSVTRGQCRPGWRRYALAPLTFASPFCRHEEPPVRRCGPVPAGLCLL